MSKVKHAVIQAQLQTNILDGHQRQEKCKRRSRESIFWPGINKDIEGII